MSSDNKLAIIDNKNPDTGIAISDKANDGGIVFAQNGKEVLKLSDKGSWIQGKKVDDKGVIYRMFKEWLSKAIMNQND